MSDSIPTGVDGGSELTDGPPANRPARRVRMMRPRDWDAVLDVEPYRGEAEMLRAFQYAVIVAEDDGEVVGYATYRQRGREGRLTRVAVRADRRAEGFGRLLVAGYAARVRRAFCRPVVVVRETDRVAIAFLAKTGWTAEGLTRGEFGDRDGVRFVLRR